jgi:mono/diheme cytochrome c family protein
MKSRTSLAMLLLLGLTACHRDMRDQPRHEPFEASTFFADGRSARPPVENTVARGHLALDSLLYAGKEGGWPATTWPFPVTAEVLKRGQERYNIYCTPCHDRLGNGEGIIVQRGFRRPPSFHIERLRSAPPGYYFDVITHGFGAMYDYSAQVRPEDRWAIAAYIRALQLSQNAGLSDVPPDRRADLDRAETPNDDLLRPSRGGGLQAPNDGEFPAPGLEPEAGTPRGASGQAPRKTAPPSGGGH